MNEATIHDPIFGNDIKSPFVENDFIYTANMIKNKLKKYHQEGKYMCIECRDVDSDDGGWVFAKYTISEKNDEVDVINFINEMNNWTNNSILVGEIETPEYIKEKGFLILRDSKKFLGESAMIQEVSKKGYYRVTFHNTGIYEALKRILTKEEWSSLLTDPGITWLPKPPKYAEGYVSYFTAYGYKMFEMYTYPLIEKYFDDDISVVQINTLDVDIVYKDKFQVVVNTSINGNNLVPNDILELNNKLNQMEYILPNKGNIITRIKYDDYINKYYGLSTQEFEKYNGGVCWDYVKYEAEYFKNSIPSVQFKTFFIRLQDSNNTEPTHTILLFYYGKSVYWFESSWKPMSGIYKFKSENDAISYIIYLMINQQKKENNNINGYSIKQYDATDKKLIGLGCMEYYDYMDNIPEYKIKLNPRKNIPVEKANKGLNEACKNVDEARKFVRDVDKLAKKYDANYFIVTDGASGTRNGIYGNKVPNDAVRNARNAQKEWENKNGFNPDEDWNHESSYFPNTEYMNEAAGKITYSSSKKYVEEIVDTLSLNDKKQIGNHIDEGFAKQFANFTDGLLYRKVLCVDGIPVVFIDIVEEKPKVGSIVIATRPEAKYRRKGYGKMLFNKMISDIKKRNDITTLQWEFDNGNVKSEAMGKSLGFTGKGNKLYLNINSIKESSDIDDDKEYGLPELKKYPMPDEKHVLSAIKFFNYVSPANEEELARNIKKKMKQYGIPPSKVGEKNRLKKYLKEDVDLVQELTFGNFGGWIRPALVFDIGSVLVDSKTSYIDSLYRSSLIPNNLAQEIHDYIMDTFKYNSEYLAYCTTQEYYKFMTDKAPEVLKKYIPTAIKINIDSLKKFPYADSLLKKLKDRGHKLYYLSNWDRWSRDELIKNGTFDFLKYFDGGVFSCDVKCSKPDHEIYNKFFGLCDTDYNSTIFFDDRADNIKAAMEAGMYGILFNKDYTPQWICDMFLSGEPIEEMTIMLNEAADINIEKTKDTYMIKNEKGQVMSKIRFFDYKLKNFDWVLIADAETNPSYRKMGLASKLLNEVYKDIRKETNSKKGIYVFVKQNNKNAIALYEKLKFKMIKEYKLSDGDYFIMAKGSADKKQFDNMNFK